MKYVLVFATVVVSALVLVFVRSRRTPSQREVNSAAAALLRELAFRPDGSKIAPISSIPGIHVVVMDRNTGGDVASLVAYADGTTSLILFSGGGWLGSGMREPVVRAAGAFRDEAAKVLGQLHSTDAYPLLPDDTTLFYIVTDEAIRSTGPIPNIVLNEAQHPLSALGRSAQDVITQVRKAS